MGAYFGAFTVFIFCLLGFSANAVYISIGSSSGSDITQVSYIAFPFSCYTSNLQNHILGYVVKVSLC